MRPVTPGLETICFRVHHTHPLPIADARVRTIAPDSTGPDCLLENTSPGADTIMLARCVLSGFQGAASCGSSSAAVKFRDANEKGPHWADPLKAWGDVLTKQGHRQEARAKYDAALKYRAQLEAAQGSSRGCSEAEDSSAITGSGRSRRSAAGRLPTC